MSDTVKLVLSEFAHFLAPLNAAVQDEAALSAFLLRFGYAVDVTALTGVMNSLAPLRDGTQALIDQVDADQNSGGSGNIDIAAVQALLQVSFSALDGFGNLFTNLQSFANLPNKAQNLALLPVDVFSALLKDYLNTRARPALHLLELFGLHEQISVTQANDSRWRGASYTYSHFNWTRLGQLFNDPQNWARDVYGWGQQFDSNTALFRVSAFLETLTGLTRLEAMSDVQVAHFLPSAVRDEDSTYMIVAPLAAALSGPALAEFGLAVFPVSGKGANTPATDKGLAVAPYSDGSLSQTLTLFPNGTLTLSGNVGALGGAVFSVRPSGLDLDLGIGATAFSGDVGLELAVAPSAGGQSKIIFLGAEGETRLEAETVSVKAGGSVTSQSNFDAYLAGGVANLSLVIDFADDGLLGSIVSEPIVVSAGDIGLGWRPGRGLYFEGGSNLGLILPLDQSLGPVNLYEVALELDFETPVTLRLMVTADLTIGPLFAYADGLGVSASLVPAVDNDGIFGKHDLAFGFVPPTTYAVALNNDVISGGGLLSVDDTEYRGALALKLQTFGLSAFAILNTELPGGQSGFSFAASLFAEFSVPLPFGFFLTGVGGVIGINRTIDSEAMRSVLYEGRLDNLIFPADPIVNAATILEDMAAILPAQSGQHVIGPVIKVGWGQPVLIEAKLGLILEIGAEVRIILLGGLGMVLPTKEAAIVDISITFFGEVDFAAATVSFDATLLNSRVLTYTISGDSAIRTGWAPRLEHIASFGGLHPAFPKPSNLPDLRRITLAFGTNNPRVTISGYTALTTNSLQFGARADLYAKGPDLWLIGQLAAEGYIYLDALIYFDPFAFDVAVGGGLSLLRNGSVVLSLGFDLRLRGPNTFHISGKVWAKVLGKKVKFSITHRWGAEQTLAVPTTDPVVHLREALQNANGLEPIPPVHRSSGVTFISDSDHEGLIDPLGGARFTQTAVPLGITIEKIGEAQLSGGGAAVDITVFDAAGQSISTEDAELSFVHGHFFQLTDAERLSATAFENHKAGFELADTGLVGAVNKAIETDYTYEYVEIPVATDAPTHLLGNRGISGQLVDDITNRFSVQQLKVRTDIERTSSLVMADDLAPRIRDDTFTAQNQFEAVATYFSETGADTASGAAIRDELLHQGLVRSSFAAARQDVGLSAGPASDAIREVNPVMTDYILAAGRN